MKKSVLITAIGDHGVGKSCMLYSFTEKRPSTDYFPSTFEEYGGKVVVDGKEFTAQLLDIVEEDGYERLRAVIYSMTSCFLICFSVDSPSSYENVTIKWIPEIKKYLRKTPAVLVGMKTDLRASTNEGLETEDGFQLKDKLNVFTYVECSALTMDGIDNVVEEAIKAILAKKPPTSKCVVL